MLNTADKEVADKIYWCNTSGQWKGVAVMEFALPPIDADRIKSAELSYTIHNGADRAGSRTYDIYSSDIEITGTTTIDTLDNISLSSSMFTGEGISKDETRTDTVPSSVICEYVSSKADADNESKVQFAFSNSTQQLEIDPATAMLSIELYNGSIALAEREIILSSSRGTQKLDVILFDDSVREAELVWSSENSEIAAVENGIVTPHSAGTTVITVEIEVTGAV